MDKKNIVSINIPASVVLQDESEMKVVLQGFTIKDHAFRFGMPLVVSGIDFCPDPVPTAVCSICEGNGVYAANGCARCGVISPSYVERYGNGTPSLEQPQQIKAAIVFSGMDQMNEHSTARLQLMEDELCKLPNLPYESMLRLDCIRMVLKIRQGREPLPITETPIACNMVHGLDPCFQCGQVGRWPI